MKIYLFFLIPVIWILYVWLQRSPQKIITKIVRGKMVYKQHFMSLEESLVGLKPDENVIFFSIANSNVAPMTLNWATHLKKTGSKFVIAALDAELLNTLRNHDIPTYPSFYKLERGTGHSSDNWKNFCRMMILQLKQILELGYDVVLSDIDVVWLRNAESYFRCRENIDGCDNIKSANVMISSDNLSPTRDEKEGATYARGGIFNTGMMFIRHSKEGFDFLNDWYQHMGEKQGRYAGLTSHQQVINTMARKPNSWPGIESIGGRVLISGSVLSTGNRFKLGILPLKYFTNGHGYFVSMAKRRQQINPYAVHATYTFDGHSGKAKQYRFEEAGLWDNVTTTGKYVTFRVPLEGYSDQPNIREHISIFQTNLNLLRKAIGVSIITNRILAIPPLPCYCDKTWSGHDNIFNFQCHYPGSAEEKFLPSVCPLDHFISPTKLRESGLPFVPLAQIPGRPTLIQTLEDVDDKIILIEDLHNIQLKFTNDERNTFEKYMKGVIPETWCSECHPQGCKNLIDEETLQIGQVMPTRQIYDKFCFDLKVSQKMQRLDVSQKLQRFTGDVSVHKNIVELVKKRSTQKKQIVMTTFDHKNIFLALHHILNIDSFGVGWVVLTYDEQTCLTFESKWKTIHKDSEIIPEIGCVWNSEFKGVIQNKINTIQNQLYDRLTIHGHLIWMARWDLMGKMALRGIEVISSDSDVVFTLNPFNFLSKGALSKYAVVIADEDHETGQAQCGFSFINGKKISPNGPSIKLITDVPLTLRRVIDSAIERDNYLFRKLTRNGNGVTIFFDQHLIKDSISTFSSGHRSHISFFADGINNYGDNYFIFNEFQKTIHEKELMSEENGYSNMDRFGIYKGSKHHVLWSRLRHDQGSLENYKKLISSLKKINNTKSHEYLQRITCDASEENIDRGPFFENGYKPLLPIRQNSLADAYINELQDSIHKSPLQIHDNEELFAFAPQWFIQTWRVAIQGTFLDKSNPRAVALHATNAWDKVGTLKTLGLWDQRVDIILDKKSARQQLALSKRVKTVSYLPREEKLRFSSRFDFVKSGCYGLAMIASFSKREIVTPRPPCNSEWIRTIDWEKKYKYNSCTHPYCHEWKIVATLNGDKYSCDVQGMCGCKHLTNSPLGFTPTDFDTYLRKFPDTAPHRAKSDILHIPMNAFKNKTTGIYTITENDMNEMIRNADENADVWYVEEPITPDKTNKELYRRATEYCSK